MPTTKTTNLWMSWTCLKPSYILVSFSFYRHLSWPSPLFIEKCFSFENSCRLSLLPSKKRNTIHNCFFRCWCGRHIGNWPNDREAKVSGVIRDAWSLTLAFRSYIFELNCCSNRRETSLRSKRFRGVSFLCSQTPRKRLLRRLKRNRSPNRTK